MRIRILHKNEKRLMMIMSSNLEGTIKGASCQRTTQVHKMNLNYYSDKSCITRNAIASADLNKVPLAVEKNTSATTLKGIKRVMGALRQSSRQLPRTNDLAKSSMTLGPLVGCKRKSEHLDGHERKRAWLKSRDSMPSKIQSDVTGLIARSACSMPALVKNKTTLANKIAKDDLDAVKAKSISTLQRGSYDHSAEDRKQGFATLPATTGSIGAPVKGLEAASKAELSPSRALHVAKMKDRFAELIQKAQHHTLLDPGAALQREKEMRQRRQHEEKANIKAQISAIFSTEELKSESKHNKQIQAKREAARIALQKMEQYVTMDDNFQVMNDFEALTGSSFAINCHDKIKSPLQRLGLYIKFEYQLGDENDYAYPKHEDIEEGEIVQS